MNMKELVDRFPTQLKEALAIAQAKSFNPSKETIQNVVVSGLGGSGIGGSIVSEILANSLKVPVYINKDYAIPAFVGKHTLFVASSYSGNTEETLEALDKATHAGAEIACITSSGKLLEIAQKAGYNYLQVPGGMPPRSCLGYSMVQLMGVFTKYQLTDYPSLEKVAASIDLLISQKETIQKQAMQMTEFLLDKTPIIYTSSGFEGVAIRLRQQLNENSKVLCWHHIIPEMNHNELVGWTVPNDQLAVVYLRSGNEYARTAERIDFLQKVISNYTANQLSIVSQGNSAIEEAFYLIHVSDWASVYLAEKRGVDAMDIDIIYKLKEHLSTF
jgi:glucose/mannose-6-phosphate isomerase